MDAAAEKITRKIHREFRHNRLAFFDEMNILSTKKHIKKLYKDVYKIIRKEFAAVLDPLYQEIYDEALALGFDGELEDLDEAWIEEFFLEYNPVTKYVFRSELSRKESRLFESLVASKKEKIKSYKTAENLLAKQVKQYTIDFEDAIAKAVYKGVGVKKVMWNAEDDHRTCSICNELDGEIFDLGSAPPKQHYQCRCFFTPVKE